MKPSKTAEQIREGWRAQRGDIRAGYEDRDWSRLLNGIKRNVCVVKDCWVWNGRQTPDGYPTVKIGGRSLGVHRLSLMAKHGADLGSQAAHHACANTACVNPEHLMPVTHRENIAEMLARQAYLARIRELEAALATAAPDHPLLAVIKVA